VDQLRQRLLHLPRRVQCVVLHEHHVPCLQQNTYYS
jgi:hypothetical protein